MRASAGVPLTSGLLIGIGETRAERIASLLALRELHGRHGHIQELIIQNFVPKPGTRMADVPAPPFEELLWTIAVARLLFGPEMNIQAPPNLNAGRLGRAHRRRHQRLGRRLAGDARPREPRVALAADRATWRGRPQRAGKMLIERLTVYPEYIRAPRALARRRPRDRGAAAGRRGRLRARRRLGTRATAHRGRRRRGTRAASFADAASSLRSTAHGAEQRLEESERRDAVLGARATTSSASPPRADELRREVCGDTVTYVVNRNINYTNLCTYKCAFCAFSKGKTDEDLRGAPYVLDLAEIARRAEEAWAPRRHRGVPAGRHPPGVHGPDLSRRAARRERGRARRCTCTPSRRWR